MPGAKRLTERIHAPFTGSRVNRDAGTIDNVLICGTTSANGRDYPVEVFRRDFAKYEGKPVNCDHSQQATVDRRLGWFSEVKPGDDGRPRGRFNCLKSHPMYERVMEAAERNPALYGFSHVAMCRTRPGAGGREVVEAIDEVESIDLVLEPATGTSLRTESRNMPLTVRALCEALVKHPKVKASQVEGLKRLGEMEGMDTAPTPMDAPPADDAEGGDAITAAFESAIMSIVKEALAKGMDKKGVLKTIGKLLDGHDDAKSGGKGKSGEEPTPEEESRQRPDYPALLKECRLANFVADDIDLAALSGLTKEQRGEYIAKHKAKPSEQPIAAGRERAAVVESTQTQPTQPTELSWVD
jgi:hypothetical protein